MTEIVLTKSANGTLIPFDQQAVEYIATLKIGQSVKAKFSKSRNSKFHKKLFALLNIAFDSWEPLEAIYKGQVVTKQFNKFRGDVTVLAGYYETSIDLNGSVKLTPKSISFSKMSEDDFEKLYSSIIDVILARILTKYSRSDLDEVVDKILSFT